MRAQQAADFKWIGKRTLRPDGVDKVTGRAAYGADYAVAGMLVGQVLRSPHAHARIVSIDTRKAQALAGVKAVISAADFPEIPGSQATKGTAPTNFCDLSDNMMARHKVLYEGHAVAAIANAIEDALGLRLTDLPMSPPRVLAALERGH